MRHGVQSFPYVPNIVKAATRYYLGSPRYSIGCDQTPTPRTRCRRGGCGTTVPIAGNAFRARR